jgi:Tfp pilus assembly protein PilF
VFVLASLHAAPIDFLDTSATTDDRGQPLLVQEALAAFRQGDLETTLNRLRQAQHEHPELPPAEVMLANMYYSHDELQKGRQALEQAAVEHPTDPEPHLIFGDLAWREQRWSDAQVQYERGGKLTASFTGSTQRKQQLKVRALAGLA